MAITFSPASYAFGSAYVGVPVTATISVTNDDPNNDATLVLPGAPFNATASSLTVLRASATTVTPVTVTIVYTPTAAKTDNATLACSVQGGATASAALSGTGIAGLSSSPSSLSFGSLPTGSTTSTVVVFTNSSATAATLVGPGGFTLSPTTISAASTSNGQTTPSTTTVTVTFAPTAVQDYSNAVVDGNQVRVLSLSGSGVAPTTVASSSGSGASSAGSASASTGSGGSSGSGASGDPSSDLTAGVQFFQVYLPNFGNATPPGESSSLAMSSFLRLGATPPTSPETTQSQALLDVARYSTPLATGNLLFDAATAAAQNLSVAVQSDCDALASGVLAAIVETAGYTGGTLVEAAAASEVSRVAWSAYQVNNAASDAQAAAVTAALGVFADDLRDQGAGLNANNLTPAQRVAESAQLLTKGGWRDHTDGNRVTTTYGDKVEVIRGNYKLIVLGRQNEVGNGLTWDSSGGMLQDNDAAPGCVAEIKWVETQGGTWRAVETATKGDVETVYDGKVVERFLGGSVTSIVGAEAQWTAAGAGPSATDPQLVAEFNDATAQGFTQATDIFAYLAERGYATGDLAHAQPGSTNPAILERTWASKIESYTGSDACPVPTMIEKTYAGSMDAHTNVTGTIHEYTYANAINEETQVHAMAETLTADIVQSTTVAALMSEFKFGAQLGIAVGGAVEIWAGIKNEISGPEALQFALNKTEAAALKDDITAVVTSLNATQTTVAVSQTGVATTSTTVQAATTTVATAATTVATASTTLAAVTTIGP